MCIPVNPADILPGGPGSTLDPMKLADNGASAPGSVLSVGLPKGGPAADGNPQPQAPKMPDQQAARKALEALAALGMGKGRGAQGTLLSGPGGIPPSILNIGRSTLLGSSPKLGG